MNFQKWELFSGSPGIIVLLKDNANDQNNARYVRFPPLVKNLPQSEVFISSCYTLCVTKTKIVSSPHTG